MPFMKSKPLWLNTFWQISLLVNFLTPNSALQPTHTSSSILQYSSGGDIWIDDDLYQMGNPIHFETPPSQNILSVHDYHQDQENRYMLYDSISPWTSHLDSQKEHLSHSEDRNPVYLKSHDESANHALGTYWNNHENPISPDNSPESAIPNPLVQAGQDFQDILDMHCISPSFYKECYDIIYSPPHLPLSDGAELLQGDNQILQKSHNEHHISSSSCTELDNMLYSTQETLHPFKKLKNMDNIINGNNKDQIPRDEGSPSLTAAQNLHSNFLNNLQASTSKDADTVADPIQDTSDSVDDVLGPQSVADHHRKGFEDIHKDCLSKKAQSDTSALRKELKKGGNKQKGRLYEQLPWSGHLLPTDVNGIDITTRSSYSAVKTFGTKRLFQAVNLPSDTTYVPQSSSVFEIKDIRIQENPFESHSNSLPWFPVGTPKKKSGRSKIRSRDMALVLQEIGAFLVNTSSSLCYQTTSWFERLEKDMIKNHDDEKSTAILINKAIKRCHLGFTMCFLGLIGVFANRGGDQFSLDMLLREGWDFLKLHFEHWRYLNITKKNDLSFETHNNDEHDVKKAERTRLNWNNPIFGFHHLSQLKGSSQMQIELMYQLIVKWDKQRTTSTIDATKFGFYHLKIQQFHDTYVKQIHGGFYGRGEIRNIAFKGVKLTGKYSKVTSEPTNPTPWGTICMSLSSYAQFHTPVGIDLCQEVHNFFVPLIDNLLGFYKQFYHCDTPSSETMICEEYKDKPDTNPHNENFRRIVKVISMAEYRVTVGFMGLVRLLYHTDHSEHTLNLILKSAWKFLKGIFSKWEGFQFNTDLDNIFNRKLTSASKPKLDYSDPDVLFNELWIYQDKYKNTWPFYCLKGLLSSWNNHLEYLQKLHPHDFDFVIRVLPDESPSKWARLLL
ncbi:hypothetical protein DFH28DRAFT_1028442 [Melampsora americana]|nr:hypothetical protein DFH28DRAFT_1028442 [Melampsora americana]